MSLTWIEIENNLDIRYIFNTNLNYFQITRKKTTLKGEP